jgi:hypothetical protein
VHRKARTADGAEIEHQLRSRSVIQAAGEGPRGIDLAYARVEHVGASRLEQTLRFLAHREHDENIRLPPALLANVHALLRAWR